MCIRDSPYVSQVKKYVAEHHNAEAIVISARIEEELIDVSRKNPANSWNPWV